MAAAPVTFDLTAPNYMSVAANATITSDRGTTAQIRGYSSGGNLLESTRRDTFGSAPGGVFIPSFGDNVAFFGCNNFGCATLELLFASNIRLLSVMVNNLIENPNPTSVNAFFDIGSYNSGVKTVAADGLPPLAPTTFDFTGDFAVGNILGIGTAFPGGISIRSITVDDPAAVVPLPAAGLLMLGGLAAFAMVGRRRTV